MAMRLKVGVVTQPGANRSKFTSCILQWSQCKQLNRLITRDPEISHLPTNLGNPFSECMERTSKIKKHQEEKQLVHWFAISPAFDLVHLSVLAQVAWPEFCSCRVSLCVCVCMTASECGLQGGCKYCCLMFLAFLFLLLHLRNPLEGSVTKQSSTSSTMVLIKVWVHIHATCRDMLTTIPYSKKKEYAQPSQSVHTLTRGVILYDWLVQFSTSTSIGL